MQLPIPILYMHLFQDNDWQKAMYAYVSVHDCMHTLQILHRHIPTLQCTKLQKSLTRPFAQKIEMKSTPFKMITERRKRSHKPES